MCLVYSRFLLLYLFLAPCIENYEDRNPPKVGFEIEFLKQSVHYNFNLRSFFSL